MRKQHVIPSSYALRFTHYVLCFSSLFTISCAPSTATDSGIVTITEPDDVRVEVDYQGPPVIRAGVVRAVKVTITNLGQETLSFPLLPANIPTGWTVGNLPDEPTIQSPQSSSDIELHILADKVEAVPYHLAVQVGGHKTVTVPFTLFGQPPGN